MPHRVANVNTPGQRVDHFFIPTGSGCVLRCPYGGLGVVRWAGQWAAGVAARLGAGRLRAGAVRAGALGVADAAASGDGSTSRSDIGILGMWRGWAVNSAEFLGFTVLWATFSYPEVPLSPGIPRYRWLLLLEWLVLRPSVTGSRADAINAELRNYVVVHPTDPQGKRPR